MCGQPGQCPTCNATFTVPQMDPRTGLTISHADPGDDGENPTPVHAYAAAGEKAPRIIRLEDDSAVIECPRCERQSPIRSDSCLSCGLPFTMEGMNPSVCTRAGSKASTAVIFALIALPLSFYGGIGIVPGAIACLLGFRSQTGEGTSDRVQAILAILLGGFACVLSATLLTDFF